MTIPMGGGHVNPSPCTEDDLRRFYSEVSYNITNLTQQIAGGAVDSFTFLIASGGTAGTWEEKVANEDVYVEADYQPVFWQNIGDQAFLFTAKGAGGGSDEEVKVTNAGVAGRLEEVIHADTWEATDTYASGTHFVVLAAPPTASTVRFYAPYNIIKNSAGDSSPNYLKDKHANTTATAYNASLHKHVYVNDTGSTLDFYLVNTDIQAIVTAMSIGAVRYCKISDSATVNVATESGSNVVPGTTSGLVELVRNTGTGQLVPGSTLTNVFYPDPTPVTIIDGRYKIGKLMPDNSDPTKLVLFDVSCYSFED